MTARNAICIMAALFAISVVAGGCSSLKKLSGQRDDTILPGQREDILPPDQQVYKDDTVKRQDSGQQPVDQEGAGTGSSGVYGQ